MPVSLNLCSSASVYKESGDIFLFKCTCVYSFIYGGCCFEWFKLVFILFLFLFISWTLVSFSHKHFITLDIILQWRLLRICHLFEICNENKYLGRECILFISELFLNTTACLNFNENLGKIDYERFFN